MNAEVDQIGKDKQQIWDMMNKSHYKITDRTDWRIRIYDYSMKW